MAHQTASTAYGLGARVPEFSDLPRLRIHLLQTPLDFYCSGRRCLRSQCFPYSPSCMCAWPWPKNGKRRPNSVTTIGAGPASRRDLYRVSSGAIRILGRSYPAARELTPCAGGG